MPSRKKAYEKTVTSSLGCKYYYVFETSKNYPSIVF
jgi:hypothetical protein